MKTYNLLELAKKELSKPDREQLKSKEILPIIIELRETKRFTWTEITTWMREHGINVRDTAIQKIYSRGIKNKLRL